MSSLKSSPYATIADVCEERGFNPASVVRQVFSIFDPAMALCCRAASAEETFAQFRDGQLRVTAPMAKALAHVVGSTPEFWLARDAQYAASLDAVAKRPRGRPVTTGPRKPTGRPKGRPVTKGPRVRVPRVNKAVNLNLRVTPDLAAAIAAAADLAGCTPAEAARRALFDAFVHNQVK